jgi:hypothetical protein
VEAMSETDTSDASGERRLVAAFAQMAHGYDTISSIRERSDNPKAQEYLLSDRTRSQLGWLIIGSRRWLGWVRYNLSPEDCPIPTAMLYMARSCFEMVWFPDRPEPRYSRETLRTLLHVFDSTAWLAEREAELPDWLR